MADPYVRNGRIQMDLTCTRKGQSGQVRQSVSGTFTADSIDAEVSTTTYLSGAGDYSMLLSHTSSVRDHNDQYVIPLGRIVRDVMSGPTSWDATHGPGEGYFTYSNLNFPIVASIIERVTGERFDIWMRREVLEPMKLDACYNWPTCSDAAIKRAVVLTQGGKAIKDDLGGRQPDCPVYVEDGPCDLALWKLGDNGALFAPQGGLRVSMRDLARVGRMLLNKGMAASAQFTPGR